MARGTRFQAALLLTPVLAVAVAAQTKTSRPGASPSKAPTPGASHDKPSDREKAGLHGPVQSCVEETEYTGTMAAAKLSVTRTFDRQGRLVETRNSDSRGPGQATTFTYDAAGRLVSRQVVLPDGTGTPLETFSYDSLSRITSIVRPGTRGSRSDFHYDEQGRKTEVQSFAPSGQMTVGSGVPPLLAAQAGAGVPEGGTVTTIYDEQDRPTEAQTRDAEGNLVSRVVRSYDAAGRVSGERNVMENPQFLIPAPERAQIVKESGASAEELNEALRQQMFGVMSPSDEVSNVYDEQGRQKERRWRSALYGEEVTATTYDDHGNVVLERVTRSAPPPGAADPADGPGFPAADQPPLEEHRFSYVYDSFGNWTEQTSSTRSSSDAPFDNFRTIRRTLTYY